MVSEAEKKLGCAKCSKPVVRGFERCSGCYSPLNPTFGWLVTEYRKRNMDRGDYIAAAGSKTKSALETWLLARLDIKVVKKKEEAPIVER